MLETLVSEETKKAFVEKFTFYHAKGVQVLDLLQECRG